MTATTIELPTWKRIWREEIVRRIDKENLLKMQTYLLEEDPKFMDLAAAFSHSLHAKQFFCWACLPPVRELLAEEVNRSVAATFGVDIESSMPDGILVDDECAMMDRAIFDRLPEYSCSIPSGAYRGKRWKRKCTDCWLMGEFVHIRGRWDVVGMRWREIEVVE